MGLGGSISKLHSFLWLGSTVQASCAAKDGVEVLAVLRGLGGDRHGACRGTFVFVPWHIRQVSAWSLSVWIVVGRWEEHGWTSARRVGRLPPSSSSAPDFLRWVWSLLANNIVPLIVCCKIVHDLNGLMAVTCANGMFLDALLKSVNIVQVILKTKRKSSPLWIYF